jgi:hypothetical protein
MTEPNGQVTQTVAADPRKKLEIFVRTVVSSKQMQASGGMLGTILVSVLPMVTTMLERATPEVVGGYSNVLARAFGMVADPAISEDQFKAQLSAWMD